jgi:hypothetical protein
MWDVAPAQMLAHRQTGLAATHDEHLNRFARHLYPARLKDVGRRRSDAPMSILAPGTSPVQQMSPAFEFCSPDADLGAAGCFEFGLPDSKARQDLLDF